MTDIHGAFPDVRLQIDAGIARITLDRPGVRNALRAQTTRGLIAAGRHAAGLVVAREGAERGHLEALEAQAAAIV